ncbi:MAG TPA: hypothetical protein VEF89_30405 [Solirubrobacteraceae bacterium]|nr:hypothetical protein [Solirubrobacteraceae bacterium]
MSAARAKSTSVVRGVRARNGAGAACTCPMGPELGSGSPGACLKGGLALVRDYAVELLGDGHGRWKVCEGWGQLRCVVARGSGA